MIDFCRKSFLSQLGKDAGNQSMLNYLRNIDRNYDRCLSEIIEQKEKPVVNNTYIELYL